MDRILLRSSTFLGCNPQVACRRAQQTSFNKRKLPTICGTPIQQKQVEGQRQLMCQAYIPQEIVTLADEQENILSFVYLAIFTGIITVFLFLLVRQVLLARQLNFEIKRIGNKVREGEASAQEHFEFGMLLLTKQLYTQANRNFEKAVQLWDTDLGELAPVYNNLGYSYVKMDQPELALRSYQKATEIQPAYFSAWMNMGELYQSKEKYRRAYECYTTALGYRPDNEEVQKRVTFLRQKLRRLGVNV